MGRAGADASNDGSFAWHTDSAAKSRASLPGRPISRGHRVSKVRLRITARERIRKRTTAPDEAADIVVVSAVVVVSGWVRYRVAPIENGPPPLVNDRG